MTQLTGAPKIVGEIIDQSNIQGGRLLGPATIIGKTLWGPIGKATLVTSPADFRRKFGGVVSYSDFPYLVLLALREGASFYIIREGHYTDPSDDSTLTAVKATGVIGAGPSSTFTATYAGEWGNSLKVTVAAAASGAANKVDITVENTAQGFGDLTRTATDVPDTPTAKDIARANSLLEYVTLDSFVTSVAPGNITLSTGAYDNASIVTADIIGNAGEGTGIWAASEVEDSPRIAAPEWADGDIDNELKTFVEARFDMKAIVRTPTGLAKSAVLDYRNGTGAYSHTKVDSWHTDLWTGGLKTVDEDGIVRTTSEMIAVLGAMSKRDTNESANISPSSLPYARVNYGIGLAYNFGQRPADHDSIYIQGVNALVMQDGRPHLFGNRTLWTQNTLLQKSNITEWLIYFYRRVKPLIRTEQFQPNDPLMWRELYNLIKPELDQSVADRAIREDWIYEGDQNVDKAEDVQYNTTADLDAGRYYFRILVKPIGATEYIGFRIGVFNTGVDFEVETV